MIRIGVVSYTNTLPLARGLERRLPEARIVPATPARIALGLESGGLDLGMVPVATLAENPEWPVVPGLGIASRGPVRSVLLVSRVEPARIERLVADPASRTSNLLARLWLHHRYAIAPEIVPGPETPEERLPVGDATVVIGDQALFWRGSTRHVVDLGGAWTEWTGLPFVFAVWAGPGANAPGIPEALAATYEENAGRLGELAAEVAGDDPPRRDLIESYLRHSIRYRLGEEENAGLRRFLRLGASLGCFGASAERVFHVHRA